MNSISFIKLVVNLESEFDFEFEDGAFKDEKQKGMTLKDKLIQIISKHCDISNHNPSDFNDLSVLNLSQVSIQSILLDIRNQYGVALDENLVKTKNLFIIDNLCSYINTHE